MEKTAEFVSPKHPDKICDQISDAILDACLKQDEFSRVAIETMGGHGIVTVTGELTTNAFVEIKDIVKEVVGKEIGVQTNIVKQSNEISRGVDTGGAGDQGIMVGYACNETKDFMPREYDLARSLCKYIYNTFPYDGKTQITLDDSGKIKTILVSFQNANSKKLQLLIKKWLKNNKETAGEILTNTAGDWVLGGFDADTGVTGRKIVVDAYGPRVSVGGGAFSGKDTSKVDRSAAYMARKIAVDYLKKYKAKEVFTKLAYAIGKKEPVMAIAVVDGKEHKITGYDLTPKGINIFLKLNKVNFKSTSMWGHFGREFSWDK